MRSHATARVWRILIQRVAVMAFLLAFGSSHSAYVVELVGPEWCYYHPYRCR